MTTGTEQRDTATTSMSAIEQMFNEHQAEKLRLIHAEGMAYINQLQLINASGPLEGRDRAAFIMLAEQIKDAMFPRDANVIVERMASTHAATIAQLDELESQIDWPEHERQSEAITAEINKAERASSAAWDTISRKHDPDDIAIAKAKYSKAHKAAMAAHTQRDSNGVCRTEFYAAVKARDRIHEQFCALAEWHQAALTEGTTS